jgi:hypothetical protein
LRVQLCGRYRGGGLGQAMQLPALSTRADGTGWVEEWRSTFTSYGLSREELPRHCKSCIDRGFIQMVDEILGFVDEPWLEDWYLLHLWEDPGSRSSPTLKEAPAASGLLD